MQLRPMTRAALAALLLAVHASVAAAGPWVLGPREYHASLGGSFFSAGSGYDAAGERVALDGLLERRSIDAEVEFSARRWLGMRLALPIVSATARDNGSVTAPVTNTGLGDLRVGLRVPVLTGARALAVNLDWQAPSGYNRVLAPLVADQSWKAAGSGLQALEASLQFGTPVGARGFLQLGGGARYEALLFGEFFEDSDGNIDTSAVGVDAAERDWAMHITADAALGLWFTDRLLVAGIYRGEFAQSTGRIVDGPNGLAPLEMTSHLAGSRVSYHLDDRLEVFAGSWHSPGGENVLHLDQFYAGLGWRATRLHRSQGFLGSARRP